MLKTVVILNIFVVIVIELDIYIYIKIYIKVKLFEIENVFTINCDQLNASFLNKSINF